MNNERDFNIGLVLDEHFWRKSETTSITVAELGRPILRGDILRDSGTGVVYEVMERGFTPKRGGLGGIMRSELSREASLSLKGKAQVPLTGRFLIPVGNKFPLWKLSIRIDSYFYDRIMNPGSLDVGAVIVGTPIVVELAGRDRSVGVFVPSLGDEGLFGDLWIPASSGKFSVGEELTLKLVSPTLSSEPVFYSTITGVRDESVASASQVHWPAEV